MIGTQAKTTRNNRLVKMRQSGKPWKDVAAFFNLSVARSKEIYSREKNKQAVDNTD